MFDQADFYAINHEIASKLDELLIPTTSNIQRFDIESIVSSLHNIFQSVIDKYVPTTSTPFNIRISNRSKALLNEKRRLCRLLNRRLNNQRAQPTELAAIHSLINQISVMIRKSLCDDFSKFYKRKLQQINSNSDAFNTIRQFSKYKRKSNSVDLIFLDKQKQILVSSPDEIVEEFANQFIKKSSTYSQRLKPRGRLSSTIN